MFIGGISVIVALFSFVFFILLELSRTGFDDTKKTYTGYYGLVIGIIWGCFIGHSYYTYPDLNRSEHVTIDCGNVVKIGKITGSTHPRAEVYTEKCDMFQARVNQGFNYYVAGVNYSQKITIMGGEATYYNVIDGHSFATATCEWNMPCWGKVKKYINVEN